MELLQRKNCYDTSWFINDDDKDLKQYKDDHTKAWAKSFRRY